MVDRVNEVTSLKEAFATLVAVGLILLFFAALLGTLIAVNIWAWTYVFGA